MPPLTQQILLSDGSVLDSVGGIQAAGGKIAKLEITTTGIVKGGSSLQGVIESSTATGLITRSPNGTRWIIQVSNTGQVSAVQIV